MKDVDDAIEQYRKQLIAEAELADSDLAEIEDHLRTLTEDLRGRGMPAAQAVEEAARRLGDPKHIAREHVRVRTAFGAKLSRMRAWSAAALLMPALIAALVQLWPYGVNRFSCEVGVGMFLTLAVALRISWARPIILGGMAFFVVPSVVAVTMYNSSPLWLLWQLAVIAFLMPWRRGELTTSGWTLALQVWTYCAASEALTFQYTSTKGHISIVAVMSAVVLLTNVFATMGTVLRARWSAILSGISTVAFLAAAVEVVGMRYRFDRPEVIAVYVATMVISGVIASALGARLAWRSASSTLGSLKHIAH